MTASVTITGDKVIKKKLSAFNTKLKNPKTTLKKSGEMLVSNYFKNFKTEGATLGSKWKPLSPATEIAKIQAGFGGAGILQRTGTLMRSIKILQLNNFLVEIGSRLSYFKYHQSSAPRNKLPRRKMIDITTSLAKNISKIFREDIILPLMK